MPLPIIVPTHVIKLSSVITFFDLFRTDYDQFSNELDHMHGQMQWTATNSTANTYWRFAGQLWWYCISYTPSTKEYTNPLWHSLHGHEAYQDMLAKLSSTFGTENATLELTNVSSSGTSLSSSMLTRPESGIYRLRHDSTYLKLPKNHDNKPENACHNLPSIFHSQASSACPATTRLRYSPSKDLPTTSTNLHHPEQSPTQQLRARVPTRPRPATPPHDNTSDTVGPVKFLNTSNSPVESNTNNTNTRDPPRNPDISSHLSNDSPANATSDTNNTPRSLAILAISWSFLDLTPYNPHCTTSNT